MSRTEELQQLLWDNLPARNYRQLARRMGISVGYLGSIISGLRKDCVSYGWTVPHVGSGNGNERIFALVLREENAPKTIKVTRLLRIIKGSFRILKQIHGLSNNDKQILLATIPYVDDMVGDDIAMFAKEMEDVSKKAGTLRRTLYKEMEKITKII